MTDQTITLATLAGDAYGQFETRERTDGESYTTLKETAPKWLHELVRSAHGDMLPDDWRYASIRSALGAIHDADVETEDDAQDLSSEWADSNVDVYTSALTAWLGSHSSRPGYCDDAMDEFGADQDSGIMSAIQRGQYMESQEIFASVLTSLVARLDAESVA